MNYMIASLFITVGDNELPEISDENQLHPLWER